MSMKFADSAGFFLKMPNVLTFTDLDFFEKYVCTFLNTCGLIIIKNVPTYVHIFGKVTYSRICGEKITLLPNYYWQNCT